MDTPLLGRHVRRPVGPPDCAEPFRHLGQTHRHGHSDLRPRRDLNWLLWLIQTALLGRKNRPHENPIRSDLRHRPLAIRHHVAARTAGARPAPHVRRHLRLLRPQSFSRLRLVDEAVPEVPSAGATADGQHGRRLGPSAGRRVRPVQHGRPLALSDGRFPQPTAAVPGVSRFQACPTRPWLVGNGHFTGFCDASACKIPSGSC